MLSDFFRINLPYGLSKNSEGEWFAFNREYLPLGWNSVRHQQSMATKKNAYSELPVYTSYKGLTEKAILTIITNPISIHRDDTGAIMKVFFYNDATNPQSNPTYWNDYFKIIRAFSKFEVR